MLPGRDDPGSHGGLFLPGWGTVGRVHRQGDTGIAELDAAWKATY